MMAVAIAVGIVVGIGAASMLVVGVVAYGLGFAIGYYRGTNH